MPQVVFSKTPIHFQHIPGFLCVSLGLLYKIRQIKVLTDNTVAGEVHFETDVTLLATVETKT